MQQHLGRAAVAGHRRGQHTYVSADDAVAAVHAVSASVGVGEERDPHMSEGPSLRSSAFSERR